MAGKASHFETEQRITNNEERYRLCQIIVFAKMTLPYFSIHFVAKGTKTEITAKMARK